jgi:hypothetical protein
MANLVKITDNGVDITKSVDWKSVDMVSVLTKEVSTLTFNVQIGVGQTVPAKTVPVLQDIIKFYDQNGNLIFGGSVTESEATIEGLLITYQITCTDWSYLFDGVLVKKNYSGLDPHDIVVDIVNTFAAGKGFTTNHVQLGNFNVSSIQFNYQQPTKCLESLAKLIGWDWYIDPNKDIHFFLGDVDDAVGEGGVAPITVDQTSGEIEWNSLDIDMNIQNMKNSVFVIGGTYQKTFTALNTIDSYKTDGIQQSYATSYGYTTASITVTVDGVIQTVGINQQTDPATVQVLYDDGARFISFTGGALGAGHTVLIYGVANIPIIAHASDPASIAAYGEYQDVISDSKIITVPEAQTRAQADILQFGHSVYDLKVNTYAPGCAIGQAILVNLPAFGITNRQLIIKRVEATIMNPGDNTLGIDGVIEYQLECIGSDTVTFTDLMTTILQQQASQTTVASSTVNENLVPTSETITITDAVTVTSTSSPYLWAPSASNNIRWGFFTWK